MKGYANITDIKNFIPCGYEKAKKIFQIEKNKSSDIRKISVRGIESKRLLPYVFLTEYEINKFAEMEKDKCQNVE